jgi:hypothetical protein
MVRLTELIDELYEPPTAEQTAPSPSPAAPWVTVNSDSVFDKFSEAASWADILEPLGWTQVKPADSATKEAWQHPTATHPISAHVLKAAPYAIVNWSENSGLPVGADQDLTKAKVYAILNYGGNQSAAATAMLKGEAVNLPAHIQDALKAAPRDPLHGLYNGPRPATGQGHQQGDQGQRNNDHQAAKPISLEQAHNVFKRWLGHDYDLDALDAMLAAAAVERLDGDPLWLLIISGSGNAKTETVQALSGIGATVVSGITSEGALLSATAKRERKKDATGGLLREIGDRGVLVIKDVTSILSMNRDLRGQVLGALREVHDGSWVRKVGTDGGQSLSWSGRIAIIGAVTTAWDQAHAVIASMGDRFVLVRVDSTTGRIAAGRKAIGNTGDEIQMRAELADAVAGVLAGTQTTPTTVTDQERDLLLAASDLVTLSRTGVEYDYRGDVIDAHAPEMPTRFAKELTQIIRGAVAVGMDRQKALRLAIRCARDSMPPLRLAIIDDLAGNPSSDLAAVRKRLDKPRATVDRQLQALHILGVLEVAEGEEYTMAGKPVTRWYYTIADHIDPTAIDPKKLPDLSVSTPSPSEERD